MPDQPRMPAAITWTGTLTALSSIAHGGDTRGTMTLLRREMVAASGRSPVLVPIISGNSLRGRLRRCGEELLRDALGYEGLLSPASAHALRGGGSLAKTSREPLSGSRLQRLRTLVPQLALFGAAGGGTIISGALDVGKVVPHLVETNHITGAGSRISAFQATQLEAYSRQDEADSHDFAGVLQLRFDEQGRPEPPSSAAASQQMLFHVETFPAGSRFHVWLRLRRPTPVEVDFLCDILDAYAADGRLGGRVGIGHGQVRVELSGRPEPERQVSWRDLVTDHRDEILAELDGLT